MGQGLGGSSSSSTGGTGPDWGVRAGRDAPGISRFRCPSARPGACGLGSRERQGQGTVRRLQGQRRVSVTPERVRCRPGDEPQGMENLRAPGSSWKPSLPQHTWSGVCSGRSSAPPAPTAPAGAGWVRGGGWEEFGGPRCPPPLQVCASELSLRGISGSAWRGADVAGVMLGCASGSYSRRHLPAWSGAGGGVWIAAGIDDLWEANPIWEMGRVCVASGAALCCRGCRASLPGTSLAGIRPSPWQRVCPRAPSRGAIK